MVANSPGKIGSDGNMTSVQVHSASHEYNSNGALPLFLIS